MSALLPLSLLGVGLLTALAPVIARRAGRRGGLVLATGLGAVAVLLMPALGAATAGDPVTFRQEWLPQLGIELSLHLDALSALFALLVLGVGVLVLAYTARYLDPGDDGSWLLTGLVAFAGAMLGLILAADVLLLFVFWELTTVVSFLLIGGPEGAGRAPALRALVITGVGGLALLAGVVLLGQVAGTGDLVELATLGGVVADAPEAAAVVALVVAAAFTKSAQVPFHFWLRGAMVAPTPVSTYLHAATMVKAGIYLLLRFSPILGDAPGWGPTLLWGGLATAVVGGVAALRAVDLKALLAGSTVSQLGVLTALVGLGTSTALLAAAVHTLAHAAFKSSLFMSVGVVDHEAGTRSLDDVAGLRRAAPGLAATLAVAGLSMAGVAPLLGFVSKEQAITAFVDPQAGNVALAVFVVASVLTVAYTTRMLSVLVGPPRPAETRRPRWAFVAPPAIAAGAGILLGPGVSWLDRLAGGAAGAAAGRGVDEHLALWHGLTTPLALSALALVVGAAAGVALRRARPSRELAAPLFDHAYAGLLRIGDASGRLVARLSPVPHLVAVVGTVLVLGGLAWALTVTPGPPLASTLPEEWTIVGLGGMAVFGVAVTRRRLAAVALLGAVGFLLAVWYVLAGAPDLALTQLLIETLIVVLVVLVFRRLPDRFAAASRRRAWGSGIVAVLGGTAAGLATWSLSGRTPQSPAGQYYLDHALEEAGGRNVVNTILVDFRGFDTLGEVTVLVVAAFGAWALLAHQRRPAGPDSPEDER